MNPKYKDLIKFVFGSVIFFLIGTLQGVIQVLPPVRAWLVSVGTPVSGPGHMIDPLAHAHMNLVGGVVILGMATTYYLIQEISGKTVWSKRLLNHSFWWTAIGLTLFYCSLMTFGIVEGHLMLTNPEAQMAVHRYYSPVISVMATIMGMGFWIFFANVLMTFRMIFKRDGSG